MTPEQATDGLRMLDQLDQVRLSSDERRMARAYLRQGEVLADVLMRVDADLRHLFGYVRRAIGAFARSKVSAVTPERY